MTSGRPVIAGCWFREWSIDWWEAILCFPYGGKPKVSQRMDLIVLLCTSFQGHLASPRCCLHFITVCRKINEHLLAFRQPAPHHPPTSHMLATPGPRANVKADVYIHTHGKCKLTIWRHLQIYMRNCLRAFTAQWVWICSKERAGALMRCSSVWVLSFYVMETTQRINIKVLYASAKNWQRKHSSKWFKIPFLMDLSVLYS